jgi:phosphomannomutase
VEPIHADLDAIIKAYDIRGTVPDQVNESLARAVGAAFVRVLGAHGSTVVVGEDMRPSSPQLARAFADGAMAQGADVLLIGLASTDLLYFASGYLEAPGAMFTASHNPAQYNGIKLCRPGAAPVGQESGLREIKEMVTAGVPDWDGATGTLSQRTLLNEYAAHVLSLVPTDGSRRLKVVVDAGNGMGGHTVPAVFEQINVELVPMYFELDGSFPNHEANPIEPENLRDLQARVLSEGADLGLAFDGDADRCFVIDERGEIVSPSALTALIAVRELKRKPGSVVIHNLITSKSVPEIIIENGGTPVRTRVGHSFIKESMAKTGAVFGGEHSGHFYFQDFWRADSGMLAALHAIAALGSTEEGSTFSSIMADYDRYPMSGEINSTVADQHSSIAAIKAQYSSHSMDELDGLTVTGPTWWFNVRPSNTEPLLRLNVEADDAPTMERVRDEVLSVIRG